jgi:hypothetical protein
MCHERTCRKLGGKLSLEFTRLAILIPIDKIIEPRNQALAPDNLVVIWIRVGFLGDHFETLLLEQPR